MLIYEKIFQIKSLEIRNIAIAKFSTNLQIDYFKNLYKQTDNI